MLKVDMIPDEVADAAARAGYEDWRASGRQEAPSFDNLKPWFQDEERRHARATIAAALNAWPGMTYERLRFTGDIGLILPVPLLQETNDE